MAANIRTFLKISQGQLCRRLNLVQKRNMATKQVKEVQEKYQRDDGVPVYAKGGILDRILLGTTCLFLALGLADGVMTLGKMAVKKG